MRKKALLVGARASFEGPWVNLEEGEWLVEPPFLVFIRKEFNGTPFIYHPDSSDYKDGKLTVVGPARIHAFVNDNYKGPDVYLSIEQVK